MQLLEWPGDDQWDGPESAVTIGVFDGMHLGHQRVFAALQETAGDRPMGAVTFHPHPREILTGQPTPLLMPLPRRLEIFEQMGLSFAMVVAFSRDFARISANDFWREFLTDRLKARHLVIGYDLCIGHKQEADAGKIAAMGRERDVSVVIVPAENTGEGETIKSTLARETLLQGDVAKVFRLLGRPFRLVGTVVRDRALGRTIGFPTANLALREGQLLPPHGVYATIATVADGAAYPAAVNIGTRPTTTQDTATVVEAHLLDFPGGDLTDQPMALEFHQRLRDERHFDGLEALKAQLHKDTQSVRHYFNTP